MGDHRASIKIEIKFHGIKKEREFWINWVQDIPPSVSDFFEEVYREGLAVYHDKMQDYYEEQKEKIERQELQRLKDKYENNPKQKDS